MKTKKIGRGEEIIPFAMEMLVDEINSDKSINSLEFERDVSHEAAKILTQGLKDNDSLKTIKFFNAIPNNDIGDQVITELASMLKVNNALESVDNYLWSKNDNVEMEEVFYQALEANASLNKLWLSNLTKGLTSGLSANKGIAELSLVLSNDSSGELAQILQLNDTVKTMNLDYRVAVSSNSAALIAEALKENKGINSFWLSSRDDDLIEQISAVLRSNPNLLNFSINSKVTESAAQEIAKSLIANCALNILSFGCYSHLTVDGALAIVQSLNTNVNLSSLTFTGSYNKLGLQPLVIKGLAEVLKHNITLRELNIRDQKISYEGIKTLSQALGADSSLTLLNVAGNNLGNKEGLGMYYLSKALASNLSLINLDLSNNCLELADSKQLGKALDVNKGLKTLNLNGNSKLQDLGVKHILDVLYSNSTLNSLDVTYCGTTKKTAEETVAVLKSNKTIKKLVLDKNTICKLIKYDVNGNTYDMTLVNEIKKYLDRNNGLINDNDKEVQEKQDIDVPSTNSSNPISIQPQHPNSQEESKEETKQNHERSVWEEKYLEHKAKSKAKKLELKEQNKALQDKVEQERDKYAQAQEDKLNMMMTMFNKFNKFNEDKEAQVKRYEKKIERSKLKKEILKTKLEQSQNDEKTTIKDSLKDSFKLFTEMFNTQKTQADELKALTQQILGMKDEKIKELQNVNQQNDIYPDYVVINNPDGHQVKELGDGSQCQPNVDML